MFLRTYIFCSVLGLLFSLPLYFQVNAGNGERGVWLHLRCRAQVRCTLYPEMVRGSVYLATSHRVPCSLWHPGRYHPPLKKMSQLPVSKICSTHSINGWQFKKLRYKLHNHQVQLHELLHICSLGYPHPDQEIKHFLTWKVHCAPPIPSHQLLRSLPLQISFVCF